MENVKGFKVFNPDWTCRGFQYEIGKTYEENVKPSVCNWGFHFCKQAKDCFNYYTFDPNNKVAEVIALGEVAEDGDKCCTNKIQIVREITWEEVLTIVNTGKACTGLCNSGNGNSGNGNSGNRNSGNGNSGNRNSGNGNSGNGNSGNRNSGNGNSGNGNSGDFNITDHETGCFCTEEHKIRFFDKESDMTFRQWRNSEAYSILCRIPFEPTRWIWSDDMTDEEKAAHPEYETTGGYLKIRDNTDCCKEWWNGLNQREKQVIMSIPNFDADKFFMITGIRVE
jgi:hypothetical protein